METTTKMSAFEYTCSLDKDDFEREPRVEYDDEYDVLDVELTWYVGETTDPDDPDARRRTFSAETDDFDDLTWECVKSSILDEICQEIGSLIEKHAGCGYVESETPHWVERENGTVYMTYLA